MASDNVFFNSGWKGRIVHFPCLQAESTAIQSTVYDSCSFKITKKLYEYCNQFSAQEYEDEKLFSDTDGLFKCAFVRDESTVVLMLIYMQ